MKKKELLQHSKSFRKVTNFIRAIISGWFKLGAPKSARNELKTEVIKRNHLARMVLISGLDFPL